MAQKNNTKFIVEDENKTEVKTAPKKTSKPKTTEVKEKIVKVENKEKPQSKVIKEDLTNKKVETKNNIEETKEVKEKTTVINFENETVDSKEEDKVLPVKEVKKESSKIELKEDKKHLKEIKAKRKAIESGKLAFARSKTDPQQGLSTKEVEERIELGYQNNTHNGSSKSIKRIIFSNVFTFFNILMVVIAGWLISVNAITDLFFMVIVTLNVVIGILQEIKAKKTIDRLSLLQAPTAIVIRDGLQIEIPVNEVVLDDILLLETGKQIPSDAIVVEGSIEVNESLLTGESDAIVKKNGDSLYSGSFVVSGRCKAQVEKVGKDNYIEQLSGEAKSYKKPKSDLLKSLNWIIYVMAVVVVTVGVTLFLMQYKVNGVDYVTAVRKTAGAMIGMIPSGLYLLSSVALAVGVIRLAQNNVMVQELYCIEMLARVSTLCLDKTGTITDGTMSVQNVVEYNSIGGLPTKNIISAMLNALHETNLTAKALEDKFGLQKKLKFKTTIPFSSQRKYNAVTFERFGTFALGAPEFVLKEHYELVKKDVEKYALQGYRVLSLVHFEEGINHGELPEETPLVVSLILIEDNIRPDAIETIDYFKRSGVTVKVISGDNPLTVSKISQRAGIEGAENYISLDGLTDQEVEQAATKYTVFGRVSPNQKRILVRTMKQAGETVAMTGDGVNDILALKEADCSIAVASGSEAARNVSHLVLMDSNFGSMPKVVAEGRRVINNVSRVACLFLTKTIFSFLLAIQALNSGGAYPISTNQLMMIDFLVIAIPSFFLVLEPNNNRVSGRFLINVIKGALPGAVTILLCSVVAFQVVNYLNSDFITSSTIIVILATHTCLLVLFKVCRPYNLLRKVICGVSYSLFVILTIAIPNFFEFRPIFSFVEYYSDNVNITTIEETPAISISDGGYYVIDGMLSNILDTKPDNTFNTTVTNDGYLVIDGHTTDYKIEPPLISIDEDKNVYLKGYDTNIKNFIDENTNLKISVDSEGYVSLIEVDEDPNLADVVHKLDYSILPEVTVVNNRIYIDNADTDYVWNEEITSVSINEDYELLINGKTITYKGAIYKVAEPTYSFNENNEFVINGYKTEANLNTLGVANISDLNVTARGQKYIISISQITEPIETDVEAIIPPIETSVAGRYVINGAYTKYEQTLEGGGSSISLDVTDDGMLTINGVKTDYKVNTVTTTGGIVQKLSTSAILLLLALMFIAAPLMKLLQYVVPWCKSVYKNIQNMLQKF